MSSALHQEVLHAKYRIYSVGEATALQRIVVPGIEAEIYIKREDLSPIHAYKWRGAYNCTAALVEQTKAKEVVTASAGNHAQGVALAARMLGITAKIFMPMTTPMMKQDSVRLHGGDAVEIILSGDTFDQAATTAKDYQEKQGCPYIHPFDDLYTIAGQATIGDELLSSKEGPFDYCFLQIGGGGIAAGVSSWLKAHCPSTTCMGVEGEGQAGMAASIKAGKVVTLDEVDKFCDGTAVKRVGDLTFEICSKHLDELMTVSNEEVCAAIQQLWECCRTIPEPSGAMGLAGLIQYAQANPAKVKGKKLLAIICGANMDFSKLALISSRSSVGADHRHYLRFELSEQKGGLLGLLESHFPHLSVSEFQYGKTAQDVGRPTIAVEASRTEIDALFAQLKKDKIPVVDVTGDADARYRIIPYNPELFSHPLFFHVHFPERQSALRDFMRRISGVANVCYFNYAYSGESIGRAIMGFEFAHEADQKEFLSLIQNSVVECRPLDEAVADRLLGK